MRIAVFGVGGIGGFLGARLGQAGHDLALIARGEHLRAIQQSGLRVESPDGDFTIHPSLATDDPSQIGEVELVILGVKAWQVPEVVPQLRPMLGPDTRVLTIQNGVEAPYQVAQAVPPERVLIGVIYVSAMRTGAGSIRNPTRPVIDSYLGQLSPERAGRTEAVDRVQIALQEAGFLISVPDDIIATFWSKFVNAVAYVGVAALARVPLGVWRNIPETRDLARRSAQEGTAVAQARGVALDDTTVQRFLDILDSYPSTHLPSTVRDILEGRPSELSALAGALVRLGREVSVATPVNEFIYAALLPQEMKARG